MGVNTLKCMWYNETVYQKDLKFFIRMSTSPEMENLFMFKGHSDIY